ncbi:MAG: hypothetical protein K9M07_05960, partial [Simkaniaceae bacterium]|nr:hypothetical protein [Simkaniaceae bacterium]
MTSGLNLSQPIQVSNHTIVVLPEAQEYQELKTLFQGIDLSSLKQADQNKFQQDPKAFVLQKDGYVQWVVTHECGISTRGLHERSSISRESLQALRQKGEEIYSQVFRRTENDDTPSPRAVRPTPVARSVLPQATLT